MNVIHFVRKKSQLNSSFIKNQIIYPKNVNQFVVYRFNDLKGVNVFSGVSGGVVELDLDYYSSYSDNILFRFGKTLSLKLVKRILEFVNENNINACHFHYGSDSGIFYPLQKKLKIPSVVSFYGYDSFSFPRRFMGLGRLFLQKRVFKYIGLILAMSPEMKNDLLKLDCPVDKLIIHYHGVPNHLIKINRDVKIKDKVTLLMLSYLDPVKGHLFVLKSLKKLVENGVVNFHLMIVGDGYFRSEIEDAILNLNLSNYVTLKGKVKYMSKDFFTLFRESDIFLHPSVKTKNDKEGIPGAIVEAMFSGLPVIGTYHGGISYVIDDGNTGLLVNEWDYNGLMNSIKTLMVDHNKRINLGLSGRQRAKEEFDIDIRSEYLKKLYKLSV